MAEINDSVTSQDGMLKVTLTAFDPRRSEDRLKIEELLERSSNANLCLVIKGAAAASQDTSTVRLNATPVVRVSWDRICRSKFPFGTADLVRRPLPTRSRQF